MPLRHECTLCSHSLKTQTCWSAVATAHAQLDARRKELAAARAEGSDASGAAAKARRRALGDCEVAIGEYDTEMTARQADYDAALAAHNELLANIQVCTALPASATSVVRAADNTRLTVAKRLRQLRLAACLGSIFEECSVLCLLQVRCQCLPYLMYVFNTYTNVVCCPLQRVNTEAASLRAERLAYEEALRAAAEAAKQAMLAALRRECAVYVIQNGWAVVQCALQFVQWALIEPHSGTVDGHTKAIDPPPCRTAMMA